MRVVKVEKVPARWLPRAEAARYMHCDPRTFDKNIAVHLRAYKPDGRSVCYDLHEIDKFVLSKRIM